MNTRAEDGPPASERTNIESDTLEAAVEQLGRELEERLAPFNELAEAAGRPFTTQALEHLPVAELVDHVDADTARAIVAALWPAGVAPAWWQTPLGRIVAAQLADVTPATETVKIAVAARMLGMGHTRVIQLLDTGLLNRSRSGVTLASVYQRIAYPGKPGRPGWRPTARTKR
jgi:hypothetical protein